MLLLTRPAEDEDTVLELRVEEFALREAVDVRVAAADASELREADVTFEARDVDAAFERTAAVFRLPYVRLLTALDVRSALRADVPAALRADVPAALRATLLVFRI